MDEKQAKVLYDTLVEKLGDGIRNFKDYLKFVDNDSYPAIGMVFGVKIMKDLSNAVNSSATYPEVIQKLQKKFKMTQFQVGVLLGHFMTIQSVRSGMNVV